MDTNIDNVQTAVHEPLKMSDWVREKTAYTYAGYVALSQMCGLFPSK